MINIDVTDGKGGKFFFRKGPGPGYHGSKYTGPERTAVHKAIVRATREMVTDLMEATPVSSSFLKKSWRVAVNTKALKPEVGKKATMHGRGNAPGGETYRVTGAAQLMKSYKLGDTIEVFLEPLYGRRIMDDFPWGDGSRSVDKAKSERFGAAVDAAISNFDIKFDAGR